MFTGIIEGLGILRAIRSAGQGKRLTIEADFVLDHTKIGDSIAVNGACLTVVKLDDRRFEVDLSPETLATSTFGKAKSGERVNLELGRQRVQTCRLHLDDKHAEGSPFLPPLTIIAVERV